MQRIKFTLLQRMLKESLTRFEFDFLIYLVQRCDHNGMVEGIYYLDVKDEIGCKTSTFYLILKNLEEKNYIKIARRDRNDMDIILLDNKFALTAEGEIDYRDYLNINKAIFGDNEYKKLRVGAKKVILYFLLRLGAGRKPKEWQHDIIENLSDVIRTDKIDMELLRSTGKRERMKASTRVIKKYFDLIKKWFNVEYKANKLKDKDAYSIKKDADAKQKVIKKKGGKLVNENAYALFFRDKHLVHVICRRNGIKHTKQNLINAAQLINQYGKKAIEEGKNILHIIENAILNCGDTLNSRSVHVKTRIMLGYRDAKKITV